MRFGSVCSGIEAASVAWHPLGWTAAWLAEIEPFPSAVLAHHYPSTPNLGDMTTIAPRVLAGEVEAPDVLVGGTPCQAFSVAGLRRSLDDDRGNLALSFVHLADAVDAVRAARGEAPAWILWENVPGVLSTHDNAFGCLLAGLVGADGPIVPPRGKWKGAGVVAGPSRVAAWRILDAQFFGVAQRRRRVFVLARGGSGAWDAADALLPVTESVRWHPAPGRATRTNSSAGPAGGAGVGGVSGPRGAHSSGGWDPGDFERNGALIPSTAPALSASVGHHGRSSPRGDGTDLLIPGGVPDVAWCLQERDAKGADSDTKPGHLIPVAFDTTQITHPANRSQPKPGDPCHPLAAAAAAPAIAYSLRSDAGREGVAKTPGPDASGRVRLRDPGFSVEVNRAPTLDASAPHTVVAPAVAFNITPEGGQGADLRACEIEVAPALDASQEAKKQDRGTRIVETLESQGYTEVHASPYEADSASVLRTLREKVGKEAVAEWGSRVLDSLRSPEVLRAWLHGASLRRASREIDSFVGNCPLPREEGAASEVLRIVWEEGPDGRTPQGRGLAKQLAHQLGKAVPELPPATSPRGAFSVRRLTPREAERLQGFPDDYTAIPWKKGVAPDGPRYRALGNSMAVPVMAHIGRAIQREEASRE